MADADLETMTFEQLLDTLEQLTRQMASGAIGIEEAAALYERAGVLHAAATERLERVQRRIDDLRPPAATGGVED
jgi:exodeoxyribonuclease VII small subunit